MLLIQPKRQDHHLVSELVCGVSLPRGLLDMVTDMDLDMVLKSSRGFKSHEKDLPPE